MKSSMKFVHTADWQIGMNASQTGSAGARVREARLETARRITELARAQSVDFILLAGDTFEDNGVARSLVQQTGEILSGADCPVYIIPGNHDPYTPASVWDHAVWRGRRNLHVLLERRPVEITGGVLFPCPLYERWSDRDPTDWVPSVPAGVIRLGLAHGTLEGIPDSGDGHPIPRDAAYRAGLDYLALGHWHSAMQIPDSSGAARTAYSGTPEPTRFGERDSGNVLLVAISAPGSPPVVRQETVRTLEWLALEEDLAAPGQAGALLSRLRGLPNPSRVLIDLHLRGLLRYNERPELERLRSALGRHFLFARLDDNCLVPPPDDEAWVEDLPAGYIREAARRLQARAARDRDPAALRALEELFRLSEVSSK